jgi:hypothetical protein
MLGGPSENGNVPAAGNSQAVVDPSQDSEFDAQAGSGASGGMPSPEPKSSLQSIIAMLQGQGQGQAGGGSTSSTDPHLLDVLRGALMPAQQQKLSVGDRITNFLAGLGPALNGGGVRPTTVQDIRNQQQRQTEQLSPQQRFAMELLQNEIQRSGNMQDRKSMVDYSNGGIDPKTAQIVQLLNEERMHGRDVADREHLQNNSAESMMARAQLAASSRGANGAREQRTLLQDMAKSHPELFTADQLQQILGAPINPAGLQAILQGKSGGLDPAILQLIQGRMSAPTAGGTKPATSLQNVR